MRSETTGTPVIARPEVSNASPVAPPPKQLAVPAVSPQLEPPQVVAPPQKPVAAPRPINPVQIPD
jgi:hypothetical protein